MPALRLSLNSKFIIGCSLTLTVSLGISFFVFSQRQERLIMQQMENEARILFKQIVITREWIANHDGVFIQRLPWIKPNPYLKDPLIVDDQGRQYVKQTPAMVTKELSRYAKDKGLYWFHITSLKLTNPDNAPDAFEKKALRQFESQAVNELIEVDNIDSSKYLRYISPLYVKPACLQCHAKQGYKVGDVRGAISITLPLDKTYADISANRKVLFIATVLIVITLIGAMFLMMRNLVLTPMRKLKYSIKQFSEGDYNPEDRLRTGDEFEDLYGSFSIMAQTLTGYHKSLNEKIREATEDLEETNRKLMEANKLLSETNARKSDFIARASHELRTPLTSIKGAMDYISAKLASFPNAHTAGTSLDDLNVFFQVINKNAERLIRMVNAMLDIERIEIGASELHFTEADLSGLIEEAIMNFQADADKKNISITAKLSSGLAIYADEDRIRQVLINLIFNALKFSPPDAEITVTAYRQGSFAVTGISDSGPGVPPAEQEKIFEKFYKRGSREGAGLGLAICKSIVEAHNGIIGMVSDGENGSRFFFKLPCADTVGKLQAPREL